MEQCYAGIGWPCSALSEQQGDASIGARRVQACFAGGRAESTFPTANALCPGPAVASSRSGHVHVGLGHKLLLTPCALEWPSLEHAFQLCHSSCYVREKSWCANRNQRQILIVLRTRLSAHSGCALVTQILRGVGLSAFFRVKSHSFCSGSLATLIAQSRPIGRLCCLRDSYGSRIAFSCPVARCKTSKGQTPTLL